MTTYLLETGKVETTDLHDDGLNGDEKAGDGIYSYVKYIDTDALPDEQYQSTHLTAYRFDIKSLGEEYYVASGHVTFDGEAAYINSLILDICNSHSEELNKEGVTDEKRLATIKSMVDEFMVNGYIPYSYDIDEQEGKVTMRINDSNFLYLTYRDKFEINVYSDGEVSSKKPKDTKPITEMRYH